MTTKTEPAPGPSSEVVPARPAKTRWAWVAGTFFGAGLLKPGPGTWGSLAATAIWYFGLRAAHLNSWELAGVTAAAALAVTLIGIPAASRIENESGRVDPGFVVIDEVAGQWVVLAAASMDLRHALVGLALFRLFDITKPWPARQLERLHGGMGIMLDDLAAGAWGVLAMLAIRHFW